MFTQRSTKKELMDDLSLNTDELQKNLQELETYNQWLGSKKVLLATLEQIYEKYFSYFQHKKITIADLGCGSGDLLRAIDQWAKTKNLQIELVGIDANQFMIDYATKKSAAYENIRYQMLDVFSADFAHMQFDIVTINSVCHHFSDAALIKLLRQLAKQTQLAIVINDLHRHWLSYFSIRVITSLFPFSNLAKHDAPLSVLRAFRRKELIYLLEQANLNHYQIHWAWAFRWVLNISIK